MTAFRQTGYRRLLSSILLLLLLGLSNVSLLPALVAAGGCGKTCCRTKKSCCCKATPGKASVLAPRQCPPGCGQLSPVVAPLLLTAARLTMGVWISGIALLALPIAVFPALLFAFALRQRPPPLRIAAC